MCEFPHLQHFSYSPNEPCQCNCTVATERGRGYLILTRPWTLVGALLVPKRVTLEEKRIAQQCPSFLFFKSTMSAGFCGPGVSQPSGVQWCLHASFCSRLRGWPLRPRASGTDGHVAALLVDGVESMLLLAVMDGCQTVDAAAVAPNSPG